MNQKSKYWYLSQFNLTQRLKRHELMYMCDSSLMKKYKKKSILIGEYDSRQHIYFLKKGTLKVTNLNDDGVELLTYLIPKGTIFGIIQLLTDDDRRLERIEAMQNSIVCRVDISLFKELMAKNKDLNNHVLKLSGLKIKRLENRLENIIFKSAEERIRAFVKQFAKEYGENRGPYYQVDLFLNNKNIASLTNTNRQKVNQVMNAMKNENTIDFDLKVLKYFRS